MKKLLKFVIIIAIVIVCAIVAVSVLQFSVEPVKEIVNDNKIINSLTFDCPTKYDQYFDKATQTGNIGLAESELVEMFELMDHRCFITVKSWAHQSAHHNEIWSTAWEDLSWGNQVYLGEIECQDQKCTEWKEDIMALKELLKELKNNP